MTRIALLLPPLLLALLCGAAVADVDGGIAAYKRGDYATAGAEFTIAADRDDPFAQNVLGTMYAQGIGVARNYKLAMDWFFKAQALGSPEATTNLAKMYAYGLGVAQSNATALQYYRDAALAGFQPAILRMAEIHDKGELGESPDAKRADDWRARLRAAPADFARAGAARAGVANADAAATADPSVQKSAPPASLPNPSGQAPAVLVRASKDAQFERQVVQRLEADRQRERKMYVASTDSTPAIAGYLKDLRVQLKNLLVTDIAPLKPDESMIVTLNILKDGTLADVELNQWSGNPKTDRRVLSSLNKLVRLQPLPATIDASANMLVVSVRLPIE